MVAKAGSVVQGTLQGWAVANYIVQEEVLNTNLMSIHVKLVVKGV